MATAKKTAAPAEKLKVGRVRPADLIPYASNSRTHSDEQVAQIAASIREFGFLMPILVDDQNNVVAGHGRLQAAFLLNLDIVPSLERQHDG